MGARGVRGPVAGSTIMFVVRAHCINIRIPSEPPRDDLPNPVPCCRLSRIAPTSSTPSSPNAARERWPPTYGYPHLVSSARSLRSWSALLGAPVVAGLIFGAHQAVGSAPAIGCHIEVAPGQTNALLNVAPDSFDSLEDPGLALGVRKEAGQLGTMLTVAGECTRALPIGWR